MTSDKQIRDIEELSNYLDVFFDIKRFLPDKPFSVLFPEFYKDAGIKFEKYFLPEFLTTFHGLMIKNGNHVKKTYGIVFLSTEMIDKLLDRDEADFMIFTHHPMEDETSGRGFIPLPEAYLHRLRLQRVSVYSLHSPLDLHEEISTTQAMARSIGIIDQQKRALCDNEFTGIIGRLPEPLPLDKFINILRKVFDNPEIHYIKNKDHVHSICVLAGGGSYPHLIKEMFNLGCDTYLTGDYISKLQNDFGEVERHNFNQIIGTCNINLIECSHYATEKLVLKQDIPLLFERIGMPYEFIEQNDPWY